MPITPVQVLLILGIGAPATYGLLCLINPDKLTFFLVLAGLALLLPFWRLLAAFFGCFR